MIQPKTSYITLQEAINYFTGMLNTSSWDNASISDQTKSLIQASGDIDKIAYIGQKLNPQSEHEFPRQFEDPLIDDTPYDVDGLPFGIKYAVCEQALALLDGFDVNKELDGLTVTASRYSTVEVQYNRDTVPMHLKCGLCAKAWQYILPFIRDNRSLLLSRV